MILALLNESGPIAHLFARSSFDKAAGRGSTRWKDIDRRRDRKALIWCAGKQCTNIMVQRGERKQYLRVGAVESGSNVKRREVFVWDTCW